MAKAKKEKVVELVQPTVSPKKSQRRQKWKLIFFLLVGLIFLFGGTITVYAFSYTHKILPHTSIAGVPVGGLTQEQAKARLQAKEKAFLDSSLQLQYQGKNWQVETKELQVQFQSDASLDQAYHQGKQGSFFVQLKGLMRAVLLPTYFEDDLTPVPETGKQYLSKMVLDGIENQPAETSLQFTVGQVEIIPGKPGNKLDYSQFDQALYQAFKHDQKQVLLQLVKFDPEVSTAAAEPAREQAQAMLASAYTLKAGNVSQSLDPHDLVNWLSTQVQRDEAGRATGLQIVIKDDQVKKLVSDFAGKVSVKPVNAVLKGENGGITVVEDGKDGVQVQIDPTVTAVKSALLASTPTSSREIQAVATVVHPDLRRDNLADLGIKELIGTATTDFSGSPTNRKFNIGVGQRSLNGGFVKDGDAYSTLDHLGPIDESTGYLPELVILNNRTVPEAGGGLCQVSTTLFRAVLNAGLPVVERTNHAYRVGYYERGVGPGLDATIYDPSPDFKWKNNTGHAIYVQSYIKDTQITFELYGSKDGRVATVSTPQILQTIPVGDPIYQQTDALYKGETKQIETAHDGARTTVTYSVTMPDGKKVDQVFNSYYKPWPAQYLVGTKDRPS